MAAALRYMAGTMPKNWRKLASEPSTDFTIFSLLREQYESPRNGQQLQASIVQAPDWINVIALTPARDCILIRQFRFGCQRVTIEIPGGMLDAGEQPLVAAKRELREETGYSAEHWTPLGRVAPNPAFQRNHLYMFLAEDCRLEGAQIQDPGEDIEVTLTPLSEIRRLIADEEIDHALVLVTFLKAQQYLSF